MGRSHFPRQREPSRFAGTIVSEHRAMKKQLFGQTREGGEAYLYTLRNQNGVQADITNYGGAIVNLLVPDRAGKVADVVLGYDTLAGYERDRKSTRLNSSHIPLSRM